MRFLSQRLEARVIQVAYPTPNPKGELMINSRDNYRILLPIAVLFLFLVTPACSDKEGGIAEEYSQEMRKAQQRYQTELEREVEIFERKIEGDITMIKPARARFSARMRQIMDEHHLELSELREKYSKASQEEALTNEAR